jgi:hypothetical protein
LVRFCISIVPLNLLTSGNTKLLISVNAHRWKNYNILKEYFDFINTQSDKSSQTEQWLEWASKKLEWYNPLTDVKEEFLDDVDKDTLRFKRKSGTNNKT